MACLSWQSKHAILLMSRPAAHVPGGPPGQNEFAEHWKTVPGASSAEK